MSSGSQHDRGGQHGHAGPPAHHDHSGHQAEHVHATHSGPAGHDKHAGHTPEMFRERFWFSLVLTALILYFDEQFQVWFGYRAIEFAGSTLAQPLLSSALFGYAGGVFLKGAAGELRARTPGMMTLIALAISVAFAYSLAVSSGLLDGMPVYWELATLILIMVLGHWIELASVRGASRALEHLASLVPSTAHKLEAGVVREVAVSELAEGELVLVRPGEQLPADGVVSEGASSVNEAFLTGESRPVAKQAGSEVVAGSVNGEGALNVTVSRTGERTTLSQIQRLVAEAQGSRSRFQNLADRAAGYLTYLALGAGMLTLVVWLAVGSSLDFAITRMVAVMVVACPHALGLAIPLVIVNATAISAKNGILVRNREAFERAREVKLVAFDKTGTLTEGRFGLSQVYSAGTAEAEALRLAAALEARSEHPLGKAIVAAAAQRGLELPQVSDFSVVAGKGVGGLLTFATAGVAGERRRYRIGRPEWAVEQGLTMPGSLQAGLAQADGRGESVVALMDEGGVIALFALADVVRPGARAAVAALMGAGVEPVMVTGDAESVAVTVAAQLGISRFHARVLPADKARLVAELKRESRTAFVGDGINDAPALLEADLGVAIGAGTNVAIESADLVLIDNDPLDVLRALSLSRASYAKMTQNLIWATGYNVVAIPLAAGVAYGWGVLLSPAAAAVLMSLSTIIVSLNAVLLRRVRLG